MKIQIVIPLWKRPEVTRFCFDHLVRMIEKSDYEIKVLCVISEQEYISICEDYGFQYIYHENNPVGQKINAGIKASLANEWDYLMMMNSDDVIEPELLNKYYKPFFENREKFFGINKVTYVKFGTSEGREIVYDFSVLGIGKCLRRDVIEKSFPGGPYRNDLNRCLDDTMMDNVMKIKIDGFHVVPKIVKYEGMLAIDFKSDVNIWPWERFANKGTPVCYSQEYDAESLIKK